MTWVALNCPQCAAPLPRVAIWRAVKCGSCGALIARTESIVMRDTFRKALLRANQGYTASSQKIQLGSQSYQLMQSLGDGDISQVYLAQRMGTLPFLVTIKLSSASSAAARYAREAQVLRELHGSQNGAASAYSSRQLLEVVAQGPVNGTHGQHALVLRYPCGYWGSLAALHERYPQGLDPRHVVWIWRRMLNVLSFVHSQGWSHGDVRPEHALVHPGDHGVRLISWASAQKGGDQAMDLLRSARIVLVLLSGTSDEGLVPSHVPTELAELVTRASEDVAFCRLHRAEGLDALLQKAAKAAYGPPSFVPLTI